MSTLGKDQWDEMAEKLLQALDDRRPIIAAKLRKMAAEIERLPNELHAWQKIFGTTQLDHAYERLRRAEEQKAKEREG